MSSQWAFEIDSAVSPLCSQRSGQFAYLESMVRSVKLIFFRGSGSHWFKVLFSHSMPTWELKGKNDAFDIFVQSPLHAYHWKIRDLLRRTIRDRRKIVIAFNGTWLENLQMPKSYPANHSSTLDIPKGAAHRKSNSKRETKWHFQSLKFYLKLGLEHMVYFRGQWRTLLPSSPTHLSFTSN